MSAQTDDPDRTEALERLVALCLERCEREGPAAIDAVCAEHPADAAELRRRMRALVENDLAGDWVRDVPERLGDFRLLRALGGGGMGVVYLARQESLAREVALKLVRPEHLYFPGARERFRREVELVAALQHPGIVPVFASGEEDGLPFFAMERVRGCTLGEALEELAGADPESLAGADLARAVGARLTRLTGEAAVDRKAPLFRGGWPDVCARVAIELARALEHAHGRGILHRDVKPSNAMVTADGRVQLFDFGLSTSEEAGKLTRTGSVLGSLPYMSPEQLDAQQVDERSDVYALGVTLVELLTLVQPFAGKGALAARDAILAGACEPPRARNARVPRDLETVCLKAMAPERARRYASAAELADDLERALAHRPVRARRAGPVLRAALWARRHPWPSAAAVLALVLVVGGPLGFAVQRSRANAELQLALDATDAERRRAEDNLELANAAVRERTQANERLSVALADVEAERERAEANLDRALAAVQTMLVEVGAEELAAVPGMGPRRDALLAEALAMFDGILAQRPDDPGLARRRADLLIESGDVLFLLNRFDDAIARGEEALETLEAAQHESGDWTLAWDAARAHNLISKTYDARWDRTEALAAAMRALDAFERARNGAERASDATDAQVAQLAADRVSGRHNVALELMRSGRLDEAWDEVVRAVADGERALAAHPDDPGVLRALAGAANRQSQVAGERGDHLAALASGERAVELQRRVVAVPEPEPGHVLTLASALFHAGEASLALDDVDGARPLLDEGAALCRRLAADHPYNENYVLRLVDNRVRLAIALDPEEAVPLFEEAAAAIGPLAARNPDRFLIRVHESQVLSNLAWALAELPDLERALPAADRAVELVERLVADFPDATDHWQSVFVHVVRGLARLRAGERPDFEEIERILAERAATRERALRGVGRLYAAWGGVLRARGATDAEVEAAATRALDLLAEAIALGFDRVHELPDDPEWAKLGEHPEFRALVGAR